jgi:hypothetical protein
MVTILAFSVICLTLVSVPTVSAQPNKPLRCEVFIALNPPHLRPPTWIGTVSGDIEGDLYVTLIGATFPGITEHYEETWEIVTADGSIEIYQKGVWSFKSFKFKSNGYVTAATGAWTYLVGADVHMRGVTTDPFAVEPCTGEGSAWICGYA